MPTGELVEEADVVLEEEEEEEVKEEVVVCETTVVDDDVSSNVVVVNIAGCPDEMLNETIKSPRSMPAMRMFRSFPAPKNLSVLTRFERQNCPC